MQLLQQPSYLCLGGVAIRQGAASLQRRAVAMKSYGNTGGGSWFDS